MKQAGIKCRGTKYGNTYLVAEVAAAIINIHVYCSSVALY